MVGLTSGMAGTIYIDFIINHPLRALLLLLSVVVGYYITAQNGGGHLTSELPTTVFAPVHPQHIA